MSPDVVLMLADIGLMLAASVWRRSDATTAVLYGLAIAVSVVIIASSAAVAVADRSPGDGANAAIWAAVACVQVKIYRWRARRSFRNSVWNPQTRRWGPGRPFMALLAPVGVATTDGRRGLLAGEWSVPSGGAPVWIDDPDSPHSRRIVGRVDQVWLGKQAPFLYGAGVIAEGADMAGRLPEVDIRPVGGSAMADSEAQPTIFPAGQIAAIRMGHQPAFNGLWLRFEEGRMP